MSATVLDEISQDDIAVSVARDMAVANKRTRELGIDILQSLITITQRSSNGNVFWRINYGTKNYIGRRGGGFDRRSRSTGCKHSSSSLGAMMTKINFSSIT